jgi:glycerol-3-phosphate dehydrogenase
MPNTRSEDDSDVLVIGAGIVGCAIARELAKYQLRIVVVEKEADVGEGTSKANSALLHTGFDARPGTLEARLVARGRKMWDCLSGELHIGSEAVGALLVAFTEAERHQLDQLLDNAHANGVTDVRLLTAEEVYQHQPGIGKGVQGGLLIPREGVIDPFGAVIGIAESAILNRVRFLLGEPVVDVQESRSTYLVSTPAHAIRTRWVINAAGLWSDHVARLFGQTDVSVTPRKGEFVVFDKSARSLVGHILLPVPSRVSKGILVAPTVFGNVIAGPTAVDVGDKADLGVTPQGVDLVLRNGLRLLPMLRFHPVVATYAGLRAVGDRGDYRIECDTWKHYVLVSGIRSTGLTAAPAIAEEIVSILDRGRLELIPNKEFTAGRPTPPWVPGGRRPCWDPARVQQDGRFGHIVCMCESVSEGEIMDALHRPLPATTVDGVKRRTWATAGRCQGYYCGAAILEVMARAMGRPISTITKRGEGSALTAGRILRIPHEGVRIP